MDKGGDNPNKTKYCEDFFLNSSLNEITMDIKEFGKCFSFQKQNYIHFINFI